MHVHGVRVTKRGTPRALCALCNKEGTVRTRLGGIVAHHCPHGVGCPQESPAHCPKCEERYQRALRNQRAPEGQPGRLVTVRNQTPHTVKASTVALLAGRRLELLPERPTHLLLALPEGDFGRITVTIE